MEVPKPFLEKVSGRRRHKRKNVINKRFKVQKEYPRLDIFLTEQLPGLSRTQVGKLIKDGRVKLDNRPVDKKHVRLQEGDVVDLELPEPEPEEKQYRPTFELTKLFEDDYLLIIDKPSGVSMHPGAGEQEETILDVFRYYYPQVEEMKDTDRPGIVHRLDKETSGVLLLAKDIVTMRRLQKQFKRRVVKKTYLALVQGRVRYKNGTIDAPIARSPRHRTRFKAVVPGDRAKELEKAREAITEFTVLRQYGDFAYIRVFPHTGRTHQVRVHMAYFGNPVLGDRLYGKGHTFERLALHAYSIEFSHPVSGNVIYSYSVFPEVFRDFLCKAHP